MTLILCPRGRGNWRFFTLRIEGAVDMFTFSFAAGEPLDIGGRAFWIVEVRT